MVSVYIKVKEVNQLLQTLEIVLKLQYRLYSSIKPCNLLRAVSRANFIPIDWYGHPEKCPQKVKSRFFETNLLASKKSFTKLFRISLLI